MCLPVPKAVIFRASCPTPAAAASELSATDGERTNPKTSVSEGFTDAICCRERHVPHIYLTEQEFSERYHVSRRTAQRWRVTGDGPPFVRLGLRKVAYRQSDCETWAAASTFSSRAEELSEVA
jgi:predicted DNA-binding transcriptional regulator AlpA